MVQKDLSLAFEREKWNAELVLRVRELTLKARETKGSWCVSDNLRKGAALNAVQIAETLIAQRMLAKQAA